MTKIGIVVGSVREGRVGDQIGNWILEQARAAHPEAEFTVIDLKDYDLPMFDGPVAPWFWAASMTTTPSLPGPRL